jgi:hypothetical protein
MWVVVVVVVEDQGSKSLLGLFCNGKEMEFRGNPKLKCNARR